MDCSQEVQFQHNLGCIKITLPGGWQQVRAAEHVIVLFKNGRDRVAIQFGQLVEDDHR
jgi:hypothetical protein